MRTFKQRSPPPTYRAEASARRRSARAGASRAGQAMIEFIVGLVAVIALIAFLIQFATLARTQLETMTEARRQAGRLALLSVGSPATPDYIRNWQPGDDERTYSRDDESTRANPDDLRRVMVDHAAAEPADWIVMDAIPENRIRDLHEGTPPASAFGLVNARVSEEVTLLPAIRHLLFNSPSVEIESEVWMTELTGFY